MPAIVPPLPLPLAGASVALESLGVLTISSTGRRLLVLFVIVLALAAFFAAGAQRYFTFENIKAQQAAVDAYYHAHPGQTALAYFALYIALTGLSLAGAATLLTLLGGAIFGLLWGTLIVSFASSIGATLA